MSTLPHAITNVSDQAGAIAGGLDTICVWSPCATSADAKPRLFGSSKAVYEKHGYCEGVEYVALHVKQTRKPVLFIGLPINTVGVVSREDTSGNTDTSVTTVVAGGSGVLAEHDGVWRVLNGGTIGTDQILLELSLDGGVKFKKVRLGTATSYADPYFGITTNFAAGDLTDGETIHTWHGTAPLSDSDGWALARAALAAQQKAFRSILLCGDLQTDDEAADFLGELNAYETENARFTYGRASVRDIEPQAVLSVATRRMTGSPNLTFEDGADTITRSEGSWIDDGFRVGDVITVDGSASNDSPAAPRKIVTLTGLVLTTTVLVDENDVAGVSVTAETGLTFTNAGDTIVRSRGSWFDDGFRDGDSVTIDGTATSTNDGTFVIDALSALTMTLVAGGVDANEVIGGSALTQFEGSGAQTKADWMADIDAAFSSVDDEFRIDLSAGRGRVLSPFSGWRMRRPAGWAASLREYGHDIHIATWRKSDGATGFDLFDAEQTLVEWDDRVDGEAGSAARFTTFCTWANGPNGAFIAQDLTRASEGSLLSHRHHVAVVNAACTINQLNTEEAAIGQNLILNADGTASTESLNTIQTQVNAALENELLADKKGEGQRASMAVWSPNPATLFNVPEPVLLGVLELLLNGTIHSVNTTVSVKSGGQ